MSSLKPETSDCLRRTVAEKQSSGRVPGIVGGVVRDGRLVWGEGVGTADVARPGVPPTLDQQFLIASNSKTFTAVVIMALRDEGKLDLDDTLDRFIPECGHPGLSIRQMLAHVSGMQREPVTDVWETLEQPDRDELVRGFAEAERVLRPHHRWHYSNLVYAMLGEVIARLDGREWFDSVQTRILRPLGMDRTTLGLRLDAAQGYYVPPFHDVPVPEPTFDFKAMAACGGLASTANDLALWSSFIADPVEDVLHPDTFEEMVQPQIMADLQRWTLAFGLGFMLRRSGDRVFVGHTGGMPGHISAVFTHRESGTGGLVLMNSTSAPDPALLAVSLADQVIDHDPKPPIPWLPGTVVPDEYAGIIGRWYSEGGPFDFVVRAGRLEAHVPGAPAHKPPAVFVRIGDDLYRTESGRETGELLRVTRDPSGQVHQMNWATYLVTREPLAFGEWLTDD
ncbi:serine hydrolase domain-containing protein [Nocardioides jensenii]|uniref:serine hydrolase domain-containing protein n=1 Tax=Nocardioides jensenii TaxID=1843 RepID=UPI00082FC23D|nr:serine hydrolase domain-containing protein [Nocardioides jensenii]